MSDIVTLTNCPLPDGPIAVGIKPHNWRYGLIASNRGFYCIRCLAWLPAGHEYVRKGGLDVDAKP